MLNSNFYYNTLHNGIRLSYMVCGKVGAPWIVLINGLLSDANIWNGVLASLSYRYRVLIFNSRGQGTSDMPLTNTYNLTVLADDTFNLINNLNIYKPWLVGLSNGGAICLKLLSKYPNSFSGSILASTVANIDLSIALKLKHWLECLLTGGLEMQFNAAAPYLWSNQFLRKNFNYLKKYYLRQNNIKNIVAGFCLQIEGVLSSDTVSKLDGVNVPVLSLIGDRDLLTPPWKCLELNNFISNINCELIANASHLFSLENPIEFANRIHKFIKTFDN